MSTSRSMHRIGKFFLAILFAFILTFTTGCASSQKQEQQSPSSDATSETSIESSSSQAVESSKPKEKFTISDVQIVDTKQYGKIVSCVITNNTDYVYKDVLVHVDATFPVKNNYGDIESKTQSLSSNTMHCLQTAPSYLNMIGNDVFLRPGANTIEFFCENPDGVIYAETNSKGITSEVTLADCTSIRVSAGEGELLNPERYKLLNPSEYEIRFEGGIGKNQSNFKAYVTNKTDFRWEHVKIYFNPMTPDGAIATPMSEGTLDAEYMKPGETEELTGKNYPENNIGYYEVLYVLVTLDS